MRDCILFAMLVSLSAAEQAPQPLPPETAKIKTERDAVVEKAKAVFDQAVAKANQEAVKKLEAAVVKITKTGDLKGANATLALIEEYKASAGDLLDESKQVKPEEKIHPSYPVSRVESSTQAAELNPRFIIDGNPQSRWQATAIADQWVAVYFYKNMKIKTMSIKWERSFAKSYNVEVNINGAWERVAEKKLGTGGIEAVPISKTNISAIRICDMTGTEWPPSIFELTLD